MYVSARGYAFLDERLYLPACWFTDAYRARRKACHLPSDVHFQTEPHLAAEMITALVQQAVVPFHWVTADASYGKNLDFLEKIDRLGKWAFIEIPSDTRVWLRTPALELPGAGPLGRPRVHLHVARTAPPPQAVRELLAHGPRLTWVRQTIKEGSKGPLVAEFAFLRVTPVRDSLPTSRVWLILQRTLSPQPEIKFYFSNAPTTCPPREFIRVSGLRWPVETTLKEGKGQVGMDQNETRTWRAWHHHLSHVFRPCPRPPAGAGRCVAHLFLMHLRLRWSDRPALTTAQARLLIAQAIAEEAWPLRNVLAILHYRQRRNYAAYRSHRKRTLKRQQQLTQSQKRKKQASVSKKSP